jgi:cyclic pyranopterin phosphate synthase
METSRGTIETIKVYSKKGDAGKELAEARLIENLGLEGDFHATGGERQVSLLCAESRDALVKQKEKGLCFSRFKENLSIRGMARNELRSGVRLEATGAALEITGETKRCHTECSLYEEGKPCPIAGQSLFAIVLKGGVIRAGDGVICVR